MEQDAALQTGEPHWTLPTEDGRLCPYCRCDLQPHQQVIVCPSCRTPHHLECWLDNGRCTTYGCKEVAVPGLWQRLRRSETPEPNAALEAPVPQQTSAPPVPPQGFDMAFFRMLQWSSLLSVMGNAGLIMARGVRNGFVGLPFSYLFGMMGLFMTTMLIALLRGNEGRSLSPPARRRMVRWAVAGVVVAVLQFALIMVAWSLWTSAPS